MLAGKTAISRAMIPQAANGDQLGTKSNRPRRISIAPLSPTNSLGNGIYGGTILTKKSGVTKCIVPAPSMSVASKYLEIVLTHAIRNVASFLKLPTSTLLQLLGRCPPGRQSRPSYHSAIVRSLHRSRSSTTTIDRAD